MISILIADDHKLFRLGIVSMLQKVRGMEVVGEAATGKEALEMVAMLQPDVVLLDIEMPEMDGFDVLKRLNEISSPTKALILTMHKSAEFIKNVVKAGASGYLKKDSDIRTLEKAIYSIVRSGSYYPTEVAQLVLKSFQEQNAGTQVSSREKEVIKLIAEGLTTKQIAEKLYLSKYTIESHRQNILLKLSLKNSAELVRYALQRGWV